MNRKSKRFTVIIIMFITMFSLSVDQIWAAEQDSEDYIKVGLKYGNNAAETYKIESDTGFILGSVSANEFSEGMPLPAYTTLLINADRGAIVITDENGTLLSSDLASSGCIMSSNYTQDGILSVDGVPYRDGVMFFVNSNGTLNLINYMTMEHYLYGVLNSELNHSNPLEALKAQAVAARSYGSLSKGNHGTVGFDVCTTTHCQVYKGYSGEYPETNQAVDETIGEKIFSQGSAVPAFYFKNSGGYTQNVEDVWSFSRSYLRGINDEYSPVYPWTATLTFDTIRGKLEASGYDPGEIKKVSIKGKNETGNVYDLEIIGSAETINLQKEKIRNVLGATVIKSLKFDLSSENPDKTNLIVRNGNSNTNLGLELFVISGINKITDQSSDLLYAVSGDGTVNPLQGNYSSDSTSTESSVTFTGSGYGHGVGMPQDSAVEMAKQGYTYDQILKKYYTDIELR